MLNDFTTDGATLRESIGRFAQRGRQRSTMDQLLESVSGSTKALQQRKGDRGVIIVLTLAGGTPNAMDPKAVLSGCDRAARR